MGAEGLKKEGQQQNAEGKGQEAQGQLSDLGSGVCLPASCKLNPRVSGLTN